MSGNIPLNYKNSKCILYFFLKISYCRYLFCIAVTGVVKFTESSGGAGIAAVENSAEISGVVETAFGNYFLD